jgi:hypothetical protein
MSVCRISHSPAALSQVHAAYPCRSQAKERERKKEREKEREGGGRKEGRKGGGREGGRKRRKGKERRERGKNEDNQTIIEQQKWNAKINPHIQSKGRNRGTRSV